MSGNTVIGNAAAPNIGGFLGAIGLIGARGVIRIQNNVVRDNGGTALIIGEGGREPEQVQHALIQNSHFSGGPNRLGVVVLVNVINSLLFQGNQCMGAAQDPILDPVILLATRANVIGNVVDAAGAKGMDVKGVDLLVSTNSVEGALQVMGTSRVIVTSNLTTSISAPGALLANNIPPP